MKRVLALILSISLLTSCATDDSVDTSTSAPPASTTTTEPTSDLPWWNDRVFYEVFVRSFKDSDGDGIGDLAGLTNSLDYLNDGDPSTTTDLGVTGIWLMPVFASPSYHGYDVTDYRTINPDYGTMEDFQTFLEAAHERGIAVLIDLVINHTSIEHPWFRASATGDSEYADWYLWSDTDPGTVSPWNGGPVWHYRSGNYYFGLFWSGMPDLNLRNPDVTAELYDIAAFWLDQGVDGFRLDAARHLIEDGPIMSGTPETIAWLEDFNRFVDGIAPEALVLGEVWDETEEVSRYLPEALDLAFEFELAEAGGISLIEQQASVLDSALIEVDTSLPELQYATFLTNHDMNRIMSEVGGDVRIAKLAATWLLTAPGVPFLYYGEEVGLQGVKPDEMIRTPMPWTDQPPGLGFTTGTPWEPVNPGYREFNVAAEAGDPQSLLSHYRSLIHARNSSVALRRGETTVVDATDPALAAFLRSEGDDHVLVILNLASDSASDISLDLASGPLVGMEGVVPLVGPEAWAPTVDATGGFTAYAPVESIPPFGFLVLRFTPEPSPPPSPTTTIPVPTTAPATDADAALVESMLTAMSTGNVEALVSSIAPDALVVVGEDGSTMPLSQPIPPEAGFDSAWDWDADGTVTLGDIIIAQNAWGTLIQTDLDVTCQPSGAVVTCDVLDADVFEQAAGLDPVPMSGTFRVEDGLIVELGSIQPVEAVPGYEEAWLAAFAEFERWLSDRHPDSYPSIFAGPCCTGSPDGLLFTRESIELQRSLLSDWLDQR